MKENLKLLSDQISNTIIDIEILDSEFKKNAKPVLEDIKWKRTKLREHWNELEKKLKNSQYKNQPQLTDGDIKERTAVFHELRKIGSTAQVLFGGRKKSKRTKRMGKKSRKLMCPKNCCGVSVTKCRCPKSCPHCNCHEIRRLRKKQRTCKKKRRKKRTKKKRRRKRNRTKRRN